MISPPKRGAIAMARADLPAAVGPIMTMSSGAFGELDMAVMSEL
jgi:hypothetical protein